MINQTWLIFFFLFQLISNMILIISTFFLNILNKLLWLIKKVFFKVLILNEVLIIINDSIQFEIRY